MAEADGDHPEDGEWLSVAAAARRLDISPRAVRGRIARGTVQWRPDGNHGRTVPWYCSGTLPVDERWEIEELREELQEARLAIVVAVAERHAADEIRKAEVGALRELVDRERKISPNAVHIGVQVGDAGAPLWTSSSHGPCTGQPSRRHPPH